MALWGAQSGGRAGRASGEGLGRAACLWAAASRHPAACPKASFCLRLCPLPADAPPEHLPRGSVPTGLTATHFWECIFPSLDANLKSLVFQRYVNSFTFGQACPKDRICLYCSCRGTLQSSCLRMFRLGATKWKGQCVQTWVHIVLLSFCVHSTLPVCMWTALLLEDELRN